MATVTGNLDDFSLTALPLGSRVVFIPSGVGVSIAAHLLATKPIYADVSVTGSWSVDLTPTTDVRPDIYYSIRLEWPDPNLLGPNQGFIGKDFPDFQLRVPPEGGVLNDLLGDLSNFLDVWVDETDNPTFAFWYQPSTALLRK